MPLAFNSSGGSGDTFLDSNTGWMGGWMDEWIDEWVDKCKDE